MTKNPPKEKILKTLKNPVPTIEELKNDTKDNGIIFEYEAPTEEVQAQKDKEVEEENKQDIEPNVSDFTSRKKDKDGYLLLPNHFVKYKMDFKQVKRVGNIAIFHRKSQFFNYEDFEVVKITRHRNFEVKDKVKNIKVLIPAAECYPGPEQWGILGATFLISQEEEAENKFKDWVNGGCNEINEINTENLEGNVQNKEKSKNSGRGRKAITKEIVYPEKHFTLKELADKNKVSLGWINLRLPDLIKNKIIEFAEAKKMGEGKGRKSHFYRKL